MRGLASQHDWTRQIVLRVEVDEDEIPFSQAIMVGLIINELVTNSLKYAFPDGRAGTIDVRLTRSAQSMS